MSIALPASGPQPILLHAPDGPRTSFGFEYRMQLITIFGGNEGISRAEIQWQVERGKTDQEPLLREYLNVIWRNLSTLISEAGTPGHDVSQHVSFFGRFLFSLPLELWSFWLYIPLNRTQMREVDVSLYFAIYYVGEWWGARKEFIDS